MSFWTAVPRFCLFKLEEKMLHTVNKTPFKSDALKSAVRIASKSDPILLIEDGVWAARPGSAVEQLMKETIASHPVYALAPDLKARGISILMEGIETIGYDGFVELAEEHQVVTWT
jgi:tRNA 2-thiouridine synthesizing protein B